MTPNVYYFYTTDVVTIVNNTIKYDDYACHVH